MRSIICSFVIAGPCSRRLRRLVVRRRRAAGRSRRQRSPRRLLDAARGVRQADRPLHVGRGQGCRVRPVVRRLRRAEPRGRGRPEGRRRRLLARAGHDATRRGRHRPRRLECRRAQGHGHRLRRRLHGAGREPEGDQGLGRPRQGRRRGRDAEPVHLRRRTLERDGRLRSATRAREDEGAGARLPGAISSTT